MAEAKQVEPTQKEVSSEEAQDLYQSAINTYLEMDMAFKLHGYRMADQVQFIKRIAQLSDYNSELYNKITQDGTASFKMVSK